MNINFYQPDITKRSQYETRNIPRYSSHKNIYRFISRKNQAVFRCESYLEFCYLFWLEFLPNILRYQVQPAHFYYLLEGKLRHYTPDVLLYTTALQLIADEVKPTIFANSIENIALFTLARAMLNERGIGFKVISEDIIHQQPGLDSLKRLYLKSHFTPDERHTDFILNKLHTQDMELQELRALCKEAGIYRPTIDKMMFDNVIYWPIDSAIQPEMPLMLVA